jgi:hypothetical protein
MTRHEAEAAIRAAVPPEQARTAVAYIGRATVAGDERLRIDRREVVLSRPVFLGFIDLLAGANWGHPCLYVFCNLAGQEIQIRLGQFPPENRLLTPIAVGSEVPEWAVMRG